LFSVLASAAEWNRPAETLRTIVNAVIVVIYAEESFIEGFIAL